MQGSDLLGPWKTCLPHALFKVCFEAVSVFSPNHPLSTMFKFTLCHLSPFLCPNTWLLLWRIQLGPSSLHPLVTLLCGIAHSQGQRPLGQLQPVVLRPPPLLREGFGLGR